MITIYNPHPHPYNIQYVNGQQSYRKEIMPLAITGFQHLTGSSQITNLQFLESKGMTIYDTTANSYTNVGTGVGMFPWATGYTGFFSQSGITMSLPLYSSASAITLCTSGASTAQAAAWGLTATTITGITVGNYSNLIYSGTPTTTSWINALNSTSFSGNGITIVNAGTNITTATVTWTLSANTLSNESAFTPVIGGYPNTDGVNYVMLDNTTPWNQYTTQAYSANTSFTSMGGQI
jgi:hypothetical protein